MQIQFQEPRFFNRLRVLDGERTVMALNLGGADKDLFLMRPCVHPLYTPAGFPVTEMGAHNFPHHKGVWIGHAQVNGVNSFHDLVDAGWIVPVRVASDADVTCARIDLDLEWRDRRGTVVATEARRHEVRRAGPAHLLDMVSTLHASHGALELEVDNHSWAGCRLIDALDQDDGGRMCDSEGRESADAINGHPVRWVDVRGAIGGHACGAALMAHPASSPVPTFARFYGASLLNPTMYEPLTIVDGASWTFGTRIAAYDGSPPAADLHRWWSEADRDPA
ncbi:MAG: PmoA family protein [Chloroflexota bacterium]|nr:PmoA family protein [Chloroflexota bacterium]MDE2919425.1 PmoA family protein [Chloroflexota bacterium]